MTTIAYQHSTKTIAYDSRRCAGNYIDSDNSNKKTVINDRVFLLSGTVHEIPLFVESFSPGEEGDLGIIGLMVENGIVFEVGTDNGKFYKEELDVDSCYGSGCSFAQAALDFGKTPEQAVKYAMKRDSWTGGKVHVFKLSDNEKA